ncbi:MAG: phosphoglucosamine mutase [Candidatus Eremiobacteraeota bacterium]|nr:phosphoglucosamine mutase [Candidatus Eremiobacteraeota bacterium]
MSLFGTDGVRGVANAELTPELAFRIGRAGAAVLTAGAARERPILIGRDTRLSGTMLEAAVAAGIAATGRDAVALDVGPTPGVALVTALTGAAAGVMISASHNPIADNGIKFFGPDGFKLSDAQEAAIEAGLSEPDALPRPIERGVGIVRRDPALADRYLAALAGGEADLSALTLVVDAAYGAAYAIGPRALRELGADVHAINAEDDGARINVACGSTDLSGLAARVRDLARERPAAHVLGVAFDGDADRALFVDEAGDVVDGDRVMLVLAREKKRRGTLANDTVVGTVMSNIGLERALGAEGIALERASVGDRYVLAQMRARGHRFGGEQSGHVIDLDRNATGDGPGTAIALFSIVARSGRTLRDLAAALRVAPQILVNVRTHDKAVLGARDVVAAIERAERELGADGRILVRPSGTEPLIRVMVEGDDRARIDALAHDVAESLRAAAR